ncbi:MAG TPA: FdrA family protein [Actinomycetota bacterium]|nr:FdrA family protein [Actinomycetota bacterium]
MIERVIVRRGAYHDSVTLMLASRDAASQDGVLEAFAVASTPLNLDLLARQGFAAEEDLSPNDLVIAVRADDEEAFSRALAAVDVRLAGTRDGGAGPEPPAPSIRAAARRRPSLNLAFVSVPGRHASYEIASALDAGLNVFCFSDGVSPAEEAALKRRALADGFLLMGADCGTAIIDGVALGFANAVDRGPVGIVGASGTGIQEVACLLDQAGVGISHAVGVGGRDLHDEVGGLMTLRAMELLAEDESTEVIAVVSKPPSQRVARRVAEAAQRAGKPVVLGFTGLEAPSSEGGAEVVSTLYDTAVRAASLCGSTVPPGEVLPEQGVEEGGEQGDQAHPRTASGSGYVRGLFSGGTLCSEAMAVLSERVGEIRSNVPLHPAWALENVEEGSGHTFIDFGEDELTQGRPHPMIDPTLRNERFDGEAQDPAVTAIVADVVLGYGAHPDPGGELAARLSRISSPRRPVVIVALCGARRDPQGLERQRRKLEEAGAVVVRSAHHAGALAAAVVAGAGS